MKNNAYNTQNSVQKQAGFTFLELSFVLIILGMIAALMSQVVPAMRRASATAETVRNLTNVEYSLQSFAAIHGRLPCADTTGDGLEDGAGLTCAVIGKLPFATLGYSGPLVNADGYDFKYALYNNPGNSTPEGTPLLGSNVTARYLPFVGRGSPVTLQALRRTGTSDRLDFCQGLRAGMDAVFDDRYLYVETLGGNKKHVPYVLVDPGVGNMDLAGDMFDGLNGSSTAKNPQFDHPNRPQSITYDDRVVVAYFDQMWEALGCSSNMATAGRAHPNIETTLALLEQSMVDYHTQLDIAVDAAFADNFSAGAGIAAATAGLLTAGASMSTDIASAINTFGVTSGAAVSAGIAIGLNTAALAVAITNQVFTVLNYNDFKDFRTNFNTLVSTKLDPLYESVKTDVDRSHSKVFSDQ
jgi:prepilin-type N-terminal cleavage/methylation domain-containing protein